MARQRQDFERRLGQEAEGALRAAQDRIEVEKPVFAPDVGEVVAGEAAVERREPLGDQGGVLALDPVELPVDGPDPVGPRLHGGEPGIVEGLRIPDRAVGQNRGQRQHVVAGLAVEARALAARVGRDHAADRGAVRGRELRSEEQSVGSERRVELVLDHAGLDPDCAALRIDRQDPVHVPRQVDHEPVGEGLAVGAGPPSPGRDPHTGEPVLREQPGDPHEVVAVVREGDGLRGELVDRVVGR